MRGRRQDREQRGKEAGRRRTRPVAIDRHWPAGDRRKLVTRLPFDSFRAPEMARHLFAHFHARPGCAQALEAAIHAVGQATRLEPGCFGWQAFRSVRVAGEFHIHSIWADSAAFERHASLPHTVHFVAAVEPLLDHPLAVALTEPMERPSGARSSGARY
jgi:quinol monooxygenase YgiN